MKYGWHFCSSDIRELMENMYSSLMVFRKERPLRLSVLAFLERKLFSPLFIVDES